MPTTKEYLRKLYLQSLEDVRNDLGTKGAFVILAFKIVVAALGISLLVALRLLENSDPIYKTVWVIFMSDILGAVILWLATPFVAVSRMPRLAAERDSDQKKRIEQFWPQNLDVRVYDAFVREMTDDNGKTIPVVTVEVVNGDKTRKMLELEAEIQHFNHTSIDRDDGPMTIPFYPEQRGIWEDNTTSITLRPEGKAMLLIAYLDRRPPENPLRVHFGEGAYTNHLFDREAMYQIEIKFTGKMDGELEFRQSHVMRVFYANPAQNVLYSDNVVKGMFYSEIPRPLIRVLKVAEQGYWHDYSSPSRRYWEQKQKEARDAESKKQEEVKERTKKRGSH